MEKYYTVDGYGYVGGTAYGKEFYFGTSQAEAEHIYDVLHNQIEPEYSELTDGIEYTDFYFNG